MVFRKILCLEFLLEFVGSFRFYFKWEKTWRPAYVYDLPSYPSLQL